MVTDIQIPQQGSSQTVHPDQDCKTKQKKTKKKKKRKNGISLYNYLLLIMLIAGSKKDSTAQLSLDGLKISNH